MIYPWQIKQWQQLLHAKQESRLPHALLLTGMTGIGKTNFADTFSRSFLCQTLNSEGMYCANCHACRLLANRAHPNVIWIEPEKEGQAIKVDQIREANEFIQQSSLQGEYRFVIINPANKMNINAANALLKTLEEPANGAIIILISDQYARLPATIISRCQRIIFPRPDKNEALNWLKKQKNLTAIDPELLLNITQGAPLLAWQWLENETLSLRQDLFSALCSLSKRQNNPLEIAAILKDADVIRVLDFMLTWMIDLLHLQLQSSVQTLVNKDYEKQLTDLKERSQMKKNLHLVDYLQQLRGHISAGINLNKQLVMESILIKWMECASCF